MSYLDRKHTSHRTATIFAVTAIEAAAVFAVVRGLTVEFRPREVFPNPEATNIPLPQPTVKPPEPLVLHPRITQHLPPEHPPIVPDSGPVVFRDFPVTPAVPGDAGLPKTAPPVPQPALGFAPRAARPLGNPGSWATDNDYPARDLREGNQGVARFSLTVGPDGRVQSCTINMSSGFPGLDRATCDYVSRRARFEPATDGSGAKVPGNYANKIRWVIPE